MELRERFREAAAKAGAEVLEVPLAEALSYVASNCGEGLLLPPLPGCDREDFERTLREQGCNILEGDFRAAAPGASAGLTGADFGIAETGTVVLESTPEAIRLASTLPAKHFVLLDPSTIVEDSLAATSAVRRLQEGRPASYLAYITGPSRTADIERILTIGVHGPRELHILLVEGLSDRPTQR